MARRAVPSTPNLIVELDRARISGDWEQVPSLLEKYAATTGQDASVRELNLAEYYVEKDDYIKAFSHVAAVLQNDANHQEALLVGGIVEMKEKNLDKALDLLNRVNALNTPRGEKLSTRMLLQTLRGARTRVRCILLKNGPTALADAVKCVDNAMELGEYHDIRIDELGAADPVADAIQALLVEILYARGILQFRRRLVREGTATLRRGAAAPCRVLGQANRAQMVAALGEQLLRGSCSGEGSRLFRSDSSSQLNSAASGEDGDEVVLALALALQSGRVTLGPDAPGTDLVVRGDAQAGDAHPLYQSNKALSEQRIVDDLVLACTRRGHFAFLADVIEHVISLRFKDHELAFQFAMALMAATPPGSEHAQEFYRAVLLLQQCIELQPDNVLYLTMASKALLNHGRDMHDLEACITLCHRTSTLVRAPSALPAYLLGLAHAKLGQLVHLDKARKAHHEKALRAFLSALALDENNCSIHFHLALLYAELHILDKALRSVARAIELDRSKPQHWHLLALVLSGCKKMGDAVQACDAGLGEDPENVQLLFTKARLVETTEGAHEALEVLSTVAKVLKRAATPSVKIDLNQTANSGSMRLPARGRRPESPSAVDNVSHARTNASQMPDTLAPLELAPSVHRSTLTAPPLGMLAAMGGDDETVLSGESMVAQTASRLQQVELWLALAGVYRRQRWLADADASWTEAYQIDMLSPAVFCEGGLQHEANGRQTEALESYLKALTLAPNYVPALQRLGILQLSLGNAAEAERHLLVAARIEPASHETWFYLGKVAKARNDAERASDCFLTAMQLEGTAAIGSYTVFDRKA